MFGTTSALNRNTPTIMVVDNRGLAVLTIAYHREQVGASVSSRIQHQVFNLQGQLIEQWDPRFFELSRTQQRVLPNQATRYSLSGLVLQSNNVDAGWQIAFHDAAGLLRDTWNSRDTHRRYHYDAHLRPARVFEQATAGGQEQCVDHFSYAGSGDLDIRNNSCGHLVRHDDPAGSLRYENFALSGQPTTQARRFCVSLLAPDWPELASDRDGLLEPEPYTTRWRHDASGSVIEQIDAVGHVQNVRLDIAGFPCATFLDGVALLKSTTYNASGQVETEQAGNNVVSTACYSAADGRLSSLKACTAHGKTLQDLHYQYDPVGNVVRIEDLSQPVQWFSQQFIQPVSTYAYDTLYQLIRATGRENAAMTDGPDLPGLVLFAGKDESHWASYTQTYRYDHSGNLTQLSHHSGTDSTYLREMVVDQRSNRSLIKGTSPIDFSTAFDACGNLKALVPGQAVQWDTRNQLRQVTQVKRDQPEGQDDDFETYIYDTGGLRVRKVRRAKTRSSTLVSEVRYLPGLEIRTRTTGEKLNVAIVQAGRNSVRRLQWESGQPEGMGKHQLRFSLSDHLQSSTLELDENAELISQENYYPYGGTAWWAARSAVEAHHKSQRYAGKERDATGLYNFGLRYYAPWLNRWVNPDPAGSGAGLNLYQMTRSNPISYTDSNGRDSERVVPKNIWHIWVGPNTLSDSDITKMKSNARMNPDYKTTVLTDSRTWKGGFDVMADLKNKFGNAIDVVDIRNTDEGADFAKSANQSQYLSAVSSESPNYAAAADILRYYWIYRSGGVYIDHDDTINRPFGDILLSKKGIAVSGLYRMPATQGHDLKYGYSLSHFAAHPGSPVLKKVLAEANKRFAKEGDALYADADRGSDSYINKILSSSGNLLFTSVINKTKSKFNTYYNDKMNLITTGDASESVHERIAKFESGKLPLRGKVQAGNAHTWMANHR